MVRKISGVIASFAATAALVVIEMTFPNLDPGIGVPIIIALILVMFGGVAVAVWPNKRAPQGGRARDVRDMTNRELQHHSVKLASRIRELGRSEYNARQVALHKTTTSDTPMVPLLQHGNEYVAEFNRSLGPRCRFALQELRERTGTPAQESFSILIDHSRLTGDGFNETAQLLENLAERLDHRRK
jgi:hypothetical protein